MISFQSCSKVWGTSLCSFTKSKRILQRRRKPFPSHPIRLLSEPFPPTKIRLPSKSASAIASTSRQPTVSSTRGSPSANSLELQELVHFGELSALYIDSPDTRALTPNELEYRKLLLDGPEKYLCFREQNPTYQLMVSTLAEQSKSKDKFFLARLMIWRIYGWGLGLEIQEYLCGATSVSQFLKRRAEVHTEKGKDALCIKAYGGQYFQNVPTDDKSMKKLWNGGVKLWSKWQRRQRLVSLGEAKNDIAQMELPMTKPASYLEY